MVKAVGVLAIRRVKEGTEPARFRIGVNQEPTGYPDIRFGVISGQFCPIRFNIRQKTGSVTG